MNSILLLIAALIISIVIFAMVLKALFASMDDMDEIIDAKKPVECEKSNERKVIPEAKTKAQERAIETFSGPVPRFITDSDLDSWNIECFKNAKFESKDCAGRGDFPEDDISIGVHFLRSRFKCYPRDNSQKMRVSTAFMVTAKFILGPSTKFELYERYPEFKDIYLIFKNSEYGTCQKYIETMELWKLGVRQMITTRRAEIFRKS